MPLFETFGRDPNGVVPVCVAFVGPRGSGKSHAAAILAPMLVLDLNRLIVAGPNGTISDQIGCRHHLVKNVTKQDKSDAEKFFIGLEQSDDSFILVLDEADSFMGAGNYSSPALASFIRCNRAYGQGAIFIGHSTAEVSKSYLNNCDLIFWARQSVPGSIEWLKRYAEPDCEGITEHIRNLPHHEFVVWAPNMNPKFVGQAKCVNGELLLWIPPDLSQDPSQSESTESDEEASTQDADANTPDATGSSRTVSGVASAETITASIGRNTSTSTSGTDPQRRP